MSQHIYAHEHPESEADRGGGLTLWFTGLSGSGKTTIAHLVGPELDRQAHRQRPGKAVQEVHLLDDALVVAPSHEAFERRERARRDHVEVGELPRGERDGFEGVEVVRSLVRSVDKRPAVRADQPLRGGDRHAVTSAGTSPSSSSRWITIAADSSGSTPSVSTTISAADGSSYGSSTPVKPLISPAKAFA